MKERFKTILLAGLILLSLYLTYILWFGSPYLEEGVLPRYEFAYFTPPPPPQMLLMPASIVLQREGEEEIHLFRRGEAEHARIWKMGSELLNRRLPGSVGERPSEEELKDLLEQAKVELVFRFNPVLPESFLWDRAGLPAEFHEITLFFSEENYFALLEGSEKILYRWIDWEESEFSDFRALIESCTGTITEKLPPRFVLQAFYPESEAEAVISIVNHLDDNELSGEENDLNGTGADEEDINGAINGSEEDITTAEEDWEQENGAAFPHGLVTVNGEGDEAEEILQEGKLIHWQIAVRGNIYVPAGLSAAELILIREELPKKELISAFFLDPAMARRIEERDGATYFTDGKKGVRIYANGTLEFSAPSLEVFNSRIPYSVALLDAAENLSLYGGWPPRAFLARREKTAGGYRLFWRSYVKGFPLIDDESSCEMLVNDKGMPYYRRNFYLIRDETDKNKTYTHYKEALYKAINMNLESFPLQEATLLALEPVYRVIQGDSDSEARAVPAWAVHFAETGRLYLDCQTLEQL